MNPEKLTRKTREALELAHTDATRRHHREVDAEHLFHALLTQHDGLAPRILERAGADVPILRARVEEALERRPRVTGPGTEPGKVYVTPRLSRLLVAAGDGAKKLGDEFVSVEHLLLAFLEERGGDPAAWLKEAGVDRDRLLEALASIRGHQRVTNDDPESAYEALTKYGTDLVELARAGKLDPVIGRD
ncbi:MAG TPA: Clp protease N-terminal domain-containing protein, partial [bacterium]|nr:Clp protease N-terminal domain-containing protein [bacterium]